MKMYKKTKIYYFEIEEKFFNYELTIETGNITSTFTLNGKELLEFKKLLNDYTKDWNLKI